MDNEHTFTIAWSIPDDQWEKARSAMAKHGRGSSYDRRGLGRYYLLYGDLDFVYDDTHFYGSAYGANGINVSLFDLALALAETYLNQRFAPGVTAMYNQLDDDLQIEFIGEDDGVRVIASDRPTALVVPRGTFERGVLSFLRGFANAIKTQLGGAIEWESMAPLKAIAERFGAN